MLMKIKGIVISVPLRVLIPRAEKELIQWKPLLLRKLDVAGAGVMLEVMASPRRVR